MLRTFTYLYHLFIAFTAVGLMLFFMLAIIYILVEGTLSYFFGVDLLDWVAQVTGIDFNDWFGPQEPVSDDEAGQSAAPLEGEADEP